MKICVLGATGRTGKEAVIEALERGHEVRALVRNPGKIAGKNNLEVIKVDVYNEDSMVEAMRGCDAVLSCLGCRAAWFSLWTISFYTDTAKQIVGAMRKAGVSRFIYMTSWFTKYDKSHGKIVNWIAKPLFLGEYTKNMEQMELYMMSECDDIEHTAVRPPMLTNAKSQGKEIVVMEGCYLVPGKNTRICRRDVAKFMVDIAENGKWKKKCVAITSLNK